MLIVCLIASVLCMKYVIYKASRVNIIYRRGSWVVEDITAS